MEDNPTLKQLQKELNKTNKDYIVLVHDTGEDGILLSNIKDVCRICGILEDTSHQLQSQNKI